MMNLSLSPQTENRLLTLAQQLGKNENELIEEAVINYLEELEDIKEAEYRLDNPESYLTLEQLEKNLNVDN
jgi:RHH-type rel operon transcriptional repressor/antitoxin RelB